MNNVNSNSSLGPFLANQLGEKYLYSVNRGQFADIGSSTLYNKHFGPDFFQKNSLYIFSGTDSGLLPRYLSFKGVPDGSRVIFVELPEVLTRLSEVLDPADLRPGIALITLEQLPAMATEFHFDEYVYLDNLYILPSLAAQNAYLLEYQPLAAAISNQVEIRSWEVKARQGMKEFLVTQLENLPENMVYGACLDTIFSGKTAILLGGGPSLNAVIPWVIEHQRNLVVLAVSRIAPILKQIGLIPDIFVAIDPQPISFQVSKGIFAFSGKPFFKDSLLVNYYHISPMLLGQWPGRSVYFGPRFPWKTPLNYDAPPRPPGPTVTHIALDTAVRMGCSQIILGGVDLCFSLEGQSHAVGKNGKTLPTRIKNLRLEVTTNGGWQAETTHAFAYGIASMGMQAKEAATAGCVIVNPAREAAQIPHVVHKPLAEIDCSPLADEARQTIIRALPPDSTKLRSDHYRSMLDELTRAKKHFKKIHRLSDDALIANDGLFGKKGRKRDFTNKKKMDDIEAQLQGPLQAFSYTVKKFGINEFLNIIRLDRAGVWDEEEVERVGRIYYQAYRDSTTELIDLVEQAEQRLESRLAEEQPNPQLKRLAMQWRQDKQPGRFRIWAMKHHRILNLAPGVAVVETLSPENTKIFTELHDEFKQIMRGEKKVFVEKPQQEEPLAVIRTKALGLYERKLPDRLEQLHRIVVASNDSELQPMQHLIRGLLAELEGQPEKAFSEYQALLHGENRQLTEDALLRIASITLTTHDFNNSLVALECLSQLSISYVPQYADLLWLLGEKNKALDQYAVYLGQVPDDLASMVKLGKYYLTLDHAEGVQTIARLILEKDPQNKDAPQLLASLQGN